MKTSKNTEPQIVCQGRVLFHSFYIIRAVSFWSLVLGIILVASGVLKANAEPITWGSSSVSLDSAGSGLKMVHLQDGSWLAAYVLSSGNNTFINLKRSKDDMRTWTQVQSISQSGRDLASPQLLQLPSGSVLVAVSSTVTNVSYRVQVYSASTYDSPFSLLSVVDANESGSSGLGVREPFLFLLPNGTLAAFYASELHQSGGYSQAISEKISSDNGTTWGAEIMAAGLNDGTSRLGKPNLAQMGNGSFLLTFENCSATGICDAIGGDYKTSRDGFTWSSGLGTAISGTSGNLIAQSFSNGLLLVTSNNYHIYYSQDYGATWSNQSSVFSSGSAPSFYQTRTNEIAAIQGTMVSFGTMAPMPYHDVFASGSAPDFTLYGGSWSTANGIYSNTSGGAGEKAISGGTTWRDYSVQVDIRLLAATGNAGIVARVSSPGVGLDTMQGYYIGVDAKIGHLVLGDEHNGYSALKDVVMSAGVPANTWIHLTAQLVNCTITATAQVSGSTDVTSLSYTDPKCNHMNGQMGLRTVNVSTDWRNLTVTQGGITSTASLLYKDNFADGSASEYIPYGGTWSVANGTYSNTTGGNGEKAIAGSTNWTDYKVQTDIRLHGVNGNAGIVVRVSSPGIGVDVLQGYYIGVDAKIGHLVIGNEHNGYTALADIAMSGGVPANTWIHLTGEVSNCTIVASAQISGSSTVTTLSYVDTTCAHMSGNFGLRVFGVAADWSNISIMGSTTTATTFLPYWAPFDSESSAGWTVYNGSWSVASGIYSDNSAGLGDKSIVTVANSGNLTIQSDLQMSDLQSNSNSGVVFGVSNPTAGLDAYNGYYMGASVGALVFGKANGAWRPLAITWYESTLTAGEWVHVMAQARGCVFTLVVQPVTQPYGYLQTFTDPGCATIGDVGVREVNDTTGWKSFTVSPN